MSRLDGDRPPLGATLTDDGAWFRVWAPAASEVTVVFEPAGAGALPEALLERGADGMHAGFVPTVTAGVRYRYRLDGGDLYPDPASRYQPEGVHGPSEVIAPSFPWTDDGWRGLDRDNVTLYELHIGTFTPEGTFRAAADRLEDVARLGVSAVQVMPVADFPGGRNWGYDGVSLFAPSRAYGRPEEFRALVDRAHALGIGVILDVVYNHFGPDGAYHSQFSPAYYTHRHHTPWGAAINLDGEGSRHVRDLFLQHATHWLQEYHVDGFRLDAVHTLIDDSETHFLAEYRDHAAHHRREGQPAPFLIAEEHRNLAHVVRTRLDGGYGFDATYADDWHHELHSLLTRSREGFLVDYAGTVRELATATREGWTFQGQYSTFEGHSKGTDPAGLEPPRFMHCVQNHDQVGNRAFGDRIYHEAATASFRAATALLLFSAATPLLFMGDEWLCNSPFLYFTDHEPELGRLVREGRRNEFRDWSAFSDPALRERIPDPQARETFERSRLDWSEREREPHAGQLRLTTALLALRSRERALRWSSGSRQQVADVDEATIAVRRESPGAEPALVIARLTGAGPLGGGGTELLRPPPGQRWERVLSTEDAEYVASPLPVELDLNDDAPWAHFRRAGAVILRAAQG